ncbi:hypothetical protein SDC9_206147 [bioreactor metagenome]|uniref:Uncharacterized protein n=1 Tax=bioreactor metagenome TaxID=1076179 RepID=A0A645J5N5_9ZZZZ
MIEYPHVYQLPSQLMKEPVSLEEIIIFMNSEVNAHV